MYGKSRFSVSCFKKGIKERFIVASLDMKRMIHLYKYVGSLGRRAKLSLATRWNSIAPIKKTKEEKFDIYQNSRCSFFTLVFDMCHDLKRLILQTDTIVFEDSYGEFCSSC